MMQEELKLLLNYSGGTSMTPEAANFIRTADIRVLGLSLLNAPAEQQLELRHQLDAVRHDELLEFLLASFLDYQLNEKIRLEAAWLAKDICDARCVDSLCVFLQNHVESYALVSAALDIIEFLSLADLIPIDNIFNIVTNYCEHDSPRIRVRIVGILGTIDSQKATKLLGEYLNDPDDAVASHAINALGIHQNVSASDILSTSINLVSHERRTSIHNALRKRQLDVLLKRAEDLELNQSPIDKDLLQGLLECGQYAVILRLLQSDLIPQNCTQMLSAYHYPQDLSKNQRSLVRKIRSTVASSG